MKKIMIFLFLTIFLIAIVSSESTYCCEKTKKGDWCIPVSDQSLCDQNFRKVPSSCEATSYCKLGTCIDSQEGTCMRNSPQKVCNDNGGVWEQGNPEDIPQCQLGCCLMGEQAAFVTQTRCKRLSAVYGLETNFRTDITNEIMCIASATSDVKGACVFEREYEKTCLFITKKECMEMGATTEGGNESSVEFFEGYLCSAESLATNCGPTEQTRCVEGRDEVYFLDSCGNLANIYDSKKIKDKNYWSTANQKDESCGFDSSNADSASCGNCDYYLGSTCKAYVRGEDKTKPNYGDNICRDLSCEYEGEKYQHGETWCAESKGVGKIIYGEETEVNIENNLPGSRYFRLVCYNGEVSIEPCSEYRQEICIQSEVNSFKTSACRANKWQDCYTQNDSRDCENRDKRDCQWISLSEGKEGCIPLYAPGFDFWNPGGEAEETCSLVSHTCVVTFEKKITGGKTCKKNCECLEESYKRIFNQVCNAMGDCGSKTNYLGIKGYYDEEASYIGIEEVNEEEPANSDTETNEEES